MTTMTHKHIRTDKYMHTDKHIYTDKYMHTDKAMSENVEFVVEDVNSELSYLAGKNIIKKFTSQADATLFRWDFGDGTPSLETRDNPIYHAYEEEGIYTVGHQACKPDWCCSGWCLKPIEVTAPPAKPKELGIGGFITLGLLFGFIKQELEKCKRYDTEEKCKKNECMWKDNKCIEKEEKEEKEF